MPPKKTPSPASTAGPPAKKAKVAASAEAPAGVATRSRAARGPAGGTTTLPAPTAGDGGAVPTNHVASLDSLPQAVRVGLAAELAQALATQVTHATAQMLADQGKVNATMMASHAQMQAKMSELGDSPNGVASPLRDPIFQTALDIHTTITLHYMNALAGLSSATGWCKPLRGQSQGLPLQ